MSAGVVAAHYVQAASGGGGGQPPAFADLLLWLSADQAAGIYAAGAEVTTWSDLSSKGNHATGVAGGSVANKPLMKKDAGNYVWNDEQGPYFTLPGAMFSGITAAEYFVSLAHESNTQGWANLGTSAEVSHYTYGGTIYDAFGSTIRRAAGSPPALGTWHTYHAASQPGTPGSWKSWINGAAAATFTENNTVAFPAAPTIGQSVASNWAWQGRYGCVLIYGRLLTTSERADVDAWLAANPRGGTP